MLEAKSLTVAYGNNKILSDINLRVAAGCSAAVMGRNGSGKSTLLKALSGVQRLSAGQVLLDGVPISEKQAQKKMGYVPQEDIVFDDLTVRDNLYFWASANGVARDGVFESAVVQMLGIGEFAQKKAGQLSGGMRKKLCIAAAILHNPAMLILDEPFSGVDIVAKQELIGYLKKLQAGGKTLVLISHDASELTALCQRFYFIKDGGLSPIAADSAEMLNRHMAQL